MKNYLKNLRFSNVVDFIFFNLTLFLIFFAWTRFIFKSVTIALVLTFSLLIAINIIKSIRHYLKSNKTASLKIKTSDLENRMLVLFCKSKLEQIDLFTSFYDKEKIECIIENLIIFKDSSAISVNFSQKKEPQESFLKTIYKARINNINKLIILCYEVNKQDKIFFENLKDINVSIYEKEDVYTKFLIKKPSFENYFEVKSGSKIKFKQLLTLSIDKSKAKGYFFSGLLIFFCSLIVRYNIYYVIMSSIMFLLALLCVRHKENPNVTKIK